MQFRSKATIIHLSRGTRAPRTWSMRDNHSGEDISYEMKVDKSARNVFPIGATRSSSLFRRDHVAHLSCPFISRSTLLFRAPLWCSSHPIVPLTLVIRTLFRHVFSFCRSAQYLGLSAILIDLFEIWLFVPCRQVFLYQASLYSPLPALFCQFFLWP